jgi:N-acetylglucosaminyl-diphospho-decaprenol L-rhamnosyltransferase
MTHQVGDETTAPQLSVSIVTYNNEQCLPSLLDALRQQTGVHTETYFFDNGSADGTCELIRRSGIGRLHANTENIGYGRAHNHNISRCRSKYVLMLNPDLEFGPALFAGLLAFAEAHPEYAFIGPHVLEGPAQRPFPPRYFYPGEGMIALEPGFQRKEIAWLNGCCLLGRRDAIEEINGFDPDYFLYQSETDLCLRARRAGCRLGYCAGTVVRHLHRQSQRESSEYEYAVRVFEGSAVFWRKHYQAADVLTMVRFQHWLSGILMAVHGGLSWLSFAPSISAARLRARRDVCRKILDASPPQGRALSKWRPIASRQSRLALEWIKRGHFPLDDY